MIMRAGYNADLKDYVLILSEEELNLLRISLQSVVEGDPSDDDLLQVKYFSMRINNVSINK